MANGAITSDYTKVTDARLVAIERDSKWQSLFNKLSFTAMIAVGIACIGVTTVVILQLSDLNAGIARLIDRVDGIENKFDRRIDELEELVLQHIALHPDNQDSQ